MKGYSPRDFTLVALLILTLFTSACVATKPSMTTTQMRAMQTKEYQNTSQLVAYKALTDALLDKGFTIESSDSDAGVIVANITSTRINSLELTTKAIMTVLTYGLNWIFGDNNLGDVVTLDISANVSQLQSTTKVRINAVAKLTNSEGQITKAETVTEPDYYNSIFEQIDKSIFLQKNLD
jgi:hypothetical protein